MPAADWFAQALAVAAALYLLLGAIIVVGRIRYDQRRRLFGRIAELVDASAGRPDDAELQASLSRLLHGSLPLVIERGVAEAYASGPVLRACAAYVLECVGPSRLQARAGGSPRRWRRIAALRTLAFARAELAWELLDHALDDDDREIVRASVVTLGQIHERRSAELLVKALREGRHSRSQTAMCLHAFPADIGDLLTPLCVDRDPVLRYWGAVLAGRHPLRRGDEQRLITLAGDVDPRVRRAALDTLAGAGSAAAVPTILSRVNDPVPFVRAHAARALGRLGATSAAFTLAGRLGDRDWWVRDAVKRSLEALGPRVEPALLAHLYDEDVFARNGVAEVLQHLGTFERLLADEALGPSDPRRQALLAKLVDAGGLRVWDAVLAHLPEHTRRRLATYLEMLQLRAASSEALTT
jgi:HEAT repeat protein